jgi:hypothetical protein
MLRSGRGADALPGVAPEVVVLALHLVELFDHREGDDDVVLLKTKSALGLMTKSRTLVSTVPGPAFSGQLGVIFRRRVAGSSASRPAIHHRSGPRASLQHTSIG